MRTSINFRPLLELVGLMVAGMLFGALLIALVLPDTTMIQNPKSYPGQMLFFMATSLICTFGAPALIWWKIRGTSAKYQEKPERSYKLYFIGIILFIATILASSGIYEYLINFLNTRGWDRLTQDPENISMVRDLLSNKSWLPLVFVVVAVIPAVAEELFFRKALFGYLHKRSGTFWSPAILSALFFAAMHQHLLAMVPIFMLGMALAYAYHISRNIWLPIALHAINNSISILGVYYGNEDDLNANWMVTLAALFVIVFVVQQKPPIGEVIDEEK